MKHVLGTAVLVVGLAASVALALEAPASFSVAVTDTAVIFSWNEVEGAAHYCVDVRASVDGTTVRLCYGTKDAGDPAATSLVVSLDQLAGDLAALGVVPDPGTVLEGTARVKALGPGRGPGPNSGPFSEPVDFVVVF